MTLDDLKNLLLTVTPNTYHYAAFEKPDQYIVWAEYGANPLSADSRYPEKAFKLQVDYFTKMEFDPNVAKIEAVLDTDEISYDCLVDYEDDTGYIHHIWDCEVA